MSTAKASKSENLFQGRSTLRADEKKGSKQEGPKNAALAAYLASKYGGDDDKAPDGSKPKKKKKKADASGGANRIVDLDEAKSLKALTPPPADKRRRAPGPGPDDDDEEEGKRRPCHVAGPSGSWARRGHVQLAGTRADRGICWRHPQRRPPSPIRRRLRR